WRPSCGPWLWSPPYTRQTVSHAAVIHPMSSLRMPGSFRYPKVRIKAICCSVRRMISLSCKPLGPLRANGRSPLRLRCPEVIQNLLDRGIHFIANLTRRRAGDDFVHVGFAGFGHEDAFCDAADNVHLPLFLSVAAEEGLCILEIVELLHCVNPEALD